MSLLTQNMKPHIVRDGGNSIWNGIMGCNLFPTIKAMKEVGAY
jgi:hypothetical protein